MSHINHKSTTPQEDKRVHYPHLLAPPALRTSNLPSYRPARYLNPVLWTFATLGRKEKEQQLREYMWRTEQTCNPSRTLTPDSVTDYTYDYDNRLIEVSLPTNNDTVEYTYDAMGRRLTKKFTYHNGANTDVTTYKYHYIGGQITEIEIDSVRNPGEDQTVLRNEEVKIHLGANSQPISYEWVKHVGESTTSATYYYHYDIHGNVLKITDSSENVKITYTYDVLGKILTETNPDNILNFFTFRGASQTIWDSEVGMYYSGGYYRPDTGTALQGTGAPVLTNPASGAMLNAVAQATSANAQLAAHAMISAATAGSESGGVPGGFSPPSGPSDGFTHSGNQGPAMNTASTEPTPTLAVCDINGVNINSDYPLLQGLDNFECYCGGSQSCSRCKGQNNHKTHFQPQEEDKGDGTIQPSWPPKPGDPGYVTPLPCSEEDKIYVQIMQILDGDYEGDLTTALLGLIGTGTSMSLAEVDALAEKEGFGTTSNDLIGGVIEIVELVKSNQKSGNAIWGLVEIAARGLAKQIAEYQSFAKSFDFAVFGVKDGKTSVLAYQRNNGEIKIYNADGTRLTASGNGDAFVAGWKGYNLVSHNFTEHNITLHFVFSISSKYIGNGRYDTTIDSLKIFIPNGVGNAAIRHTNTTIPYLQITNNYIAAGDVLKINSAKSIERFKNGENLGEVRLGYFIDGIFVDNMDLKMRFIRALLGKE